MQRFEHLSELQARVGQEIGMSDWVVVSQARIDRFADATGDRQWIHVDVERAATGPYGTTVAHGFLTLALLPEMSFSAFEIVDSPLGVNYGLGRVRFPAPVPAGCRLRGRFELLAFEEIAGGAQLTSLVTMEREGGGKPVCVAESVVRRFV